MRIKKSVLLAANFLVLLSLYAGAQSVQPPLAFDISPMEGTSLPTGVIEGHTATAFYTVTDKTGGPFPPELYNYVKHLPKNVTQVTSNSSIPDLCGETFKLAPYGSCTLELKISGPVSDECIYDDDSANPCLFVCMDDGFTCAGTEYPLEVGAAISPVVGGKYNDTYPMIAANTGESKNADGWNYTLDNNGPLPHDFAYGVFIGATCAGNTTCLGVGGYGADDGKTYPMIAVSTTDGWEYAIENAQGLLPPGYDGFASFDAVSCTGNFCAAGGQVETQDGIYPMLAVSTQGGIKGSWQYVNKLVPTHSTNGFFDGVSCAGNVCAAGGQYELGTKTGPKTYPFLAINENIASSGTDWIVAIDSSTPLSGFVNKGTFNSVACSENNICIAGGQYSVDNTGSQNYPMLAVPGTTGWHYVIDNTKLPAGCDTTPSVCSGILDGISCSGSVCAASGNYSDEDGNSYPFVAVNTDIAGSGTWKYPIDSNSITPENFSNGQPNGLFAISCSGQMCSAVGQYYSTAPGNKIFPMMVLSPYVTDDTSWKYVIDSSVISVTHPYQYDSGGSFYGVACTGNSCIAEGYYMAMNGTYYSLLTENVQGNLDKGNWVYPIDAAGPLPNGFAEDGLFCGTTTAVCSLSP